MLNVKSCFPPGTEETLLRTREDGSKYLEYRLAGELIGAAHVHADGGVWAYALKNDEKHGFEREWNRDGSLTFESYWEQGKEHGTARQWADNGILIGTYHMDHGTGLDLWRCNITHTLSEERHLRDGRFHGFTRWWNEDGQTVYEEHHCVDGKENGIARMWNIQGSPAGELQPGYPQFFISGQRVTQEEYMRACESNSSLPQFREKDNHPERKLPREYLEQLANGIGLRRPGK